MLNFKSVPSYSRKYVKSLLIYHMNDFKSTQYYYFHYKFERNPTRLSALTSSKLINEILTVLSICTRKIQTSQSMYMSRMLQFSYRPRRFYGFYRGEGRSYETLTEWDRHVDVLVFLNSDLRKQQSRGDVEYNIHEE